MSSWIVVSFLAAGALWAQTGTSTKSDPEPKRLTVGLRVREMPARSLGVMDSQTTLSTIPTPAPIRDYQFVTASHSSRLGYGATIEYVLTNRWTMSADVMLNKLAYTKVTTVAWGSDDPSTVNDERQHSFVNEDTRAKLIDLPLMLHYRAFAASGPLHSLYLTGGATIRTAINVHSSTVITNADTTTSTNHLLVRPGKRNVVGGVIGIGYRIFDDFKITWTPEIRYTRWAGSTFSADSTMSPRNQLEIGMGFTF